jgi:RNA polymerase sigma-70 factor (ECF subfamily)
MNGPFKGVFPVSAGAAGQAQVATDVSSIGSAATGNLSSAGVMIAKDVAKLVPQADEQETGRASLEEQVLSHVKGLRRYALLLSGNRADSDDMVQETMARVLARTSSWRQVKDMRSYLFATLHNIFIDHTRKQSRMADTVDIDAVIANLSSPAAQIKRLELRDLLAGLAKLPAEQREVVLLVGLEGMSYQKASETLGVPIGTVMSRLSRGREALRVLTSRTARTKLRVVK